MSEACIAWLAERILRLNTMENKKSIRTAALLIAAFLILVTAACMIYLTVVRNHTQSCVAEIYQNGDLIYTIPLDQVQEPYTLDIKGENGHVNRIEVRPGSIGIISADCPDLLCVRQGFIHSPAIPVTCLPNRLVIRLRSAENETIGAEPDAVTY